MQWTVSGYTGVRELGSGASGRVVLALHEATGTPVAIKYLSEELHADAGFLTEFRAEAKLLGDLDTDHVVRLFEYVENPAGAAIVMELVDGIALRALLRQAGATGPEAALVVLKGSLLGLAAAHRLGVVHRDYKPENVLVAADGSSKLVDFGIAVHRGDEGSIAGTPPYMAPEQWTGAPASPAADVYAATATFFECLTGSRPYPGTTFAELVVQHTEAPIPVEETPDSVRPLILRGLAKTPEERPDSAESFVAELEAVAGEAYGPDWEKRGREDLAALALLLPLLFPSAAGGIPTASTAVATTELGPPSPPAPPAPRPHGPRLRWGRGPRQVVLVGLGGLVLLGVLGGVAVAVSGSSHTQTTGGPQPKAVTSLSATSSTAPGGGTPSASAKASASASRSASASASASASTRASSGASSSPSSPTSGSTPTKGTPSAPPTHSAPPTYVTVPSVLGLSAASAESKLENAGFSVSVNDSACTGPNRGVFSQSPGGGAQELPGTGVSISAMAPDCYQYPDEVGVYPTTAEAALRADGFSNVSITPACDYGYYPTEQQYPAPEGQYLLGSTPITLTSLCIPG
jgi:serine/threonine protein kinase